MTDRLHRGKEKTKKGNKKDEKNSFVKGSWMDGQTAYLTAGFLTSQKQAKKTSQIR